ncbi:hypothetical protein CPB86DRAFT_536354 [Serendipita vermifera]|nr:hypothetical protein CPB86DRAFT_536354 [Serendipita vermifera]
MRWLLALISRSFLGTLAPRAVTVPPGVGPLSVQYRVACDAIDWTFSGGVPPYTVYAAHQGPNGLSDPKTIKKLFNTSSNSYHYTMPPEMANYTEIFHFSVMDYYYVTNTRTVLYPRPSENCDDAVPFTSMTLGGLNTQSGSGVTSKNTRSITSLQGVAFTHPIFQTIGAATRTSSSTAVATPVTTTNPQPSSAADSPPQPTQTLVEEQSPPSPSIMDTRSPSMDDLPSVSLVAETRVVTTVVSSGDDVQTITSMQSFFSTMTLVNSPTNDEIAVGPASSTMEHPPVVNNSGDRKGTSVISISSGAGIIIGATAGAAVLGLAGFAIYRYRISSRRAKNLSQDRLPLHN